MKIKCKNCEHEWNYKGESKYYVTCPHCYNKVNIKYKFVEEKENEFNNID